MLISVGSWVLNDYWRPGAHISENTEANFQLGITFFNKLYIWNLNNYIHA